VKRHNGACALVPGAEDKEAHECAGTHLAL